MSLPLLIRAAEPRDETALGELDRRGWSALHSVQPRPRPPYPPFFDSAHRPAHHLVAELPAGTAPGAARAAAEAAAGVAQGTAAEPAGGSAAEQLPEGIVGYIRVVPSTPLLCNAHVRQIQGFLVDPRVRGRGVARALLDAACARARAHGIVRLTLRVLGHNTRARELYASAGFAVEGVLPGEFLLEGSYVDDILMGRRLGPGAGEPDDA